MNDDIANWAWTPGLLIGSGCGTRVTQLVADPSPASSAYRCQLLSPGQSCHQSPTLHLSGGKKSLGLDQTDGDRSP